MGPFSWCFCDTGAIKTMQEDWYTRVRPRNGQRLIYGHPACVLFPKEFGGKDAQIDVSSYEDYGRFGGKDIYNLVADWNRAWIAANPDWIRPHDAACAARDPGWKCRPIGKKSWFPFFSDLSLSREEVVQRWREAAAKSDGEGEFPYWLEYRQIGIDIACYDEDNAALPYPIKIARNRESVYEDCPASYGDPYQGFDD